MKILILSEYFLDKTSPISLCVESLLDGLTELGIETDLICFGNNNYEFSYNNVNVYVLKLEDLNIDRQSLIKKTFTLFRRVIIWPNVLTSNYKKMLTKSKDLLSLHNYSAVIAVHRTFATLSTIIRLNDFQIKKIVYLLDPINGNFGVYKAGIRKLLFPIIKIKEFFVFYFVDNIVFMNCHKKKYFYSWFGLFNLKKRIFDFPLLNYKKFIHNFDSNVYNNNELKFVLYGGLFIADRNPKYFLELFSKLSRSKNIVLDLFCRGNCKELIDQYKSKFKINDNGIIENYMFSSRLNKYEYIINIGNFDIDMLPSKIFQMFMTGKPIIHFAKSRDDCCNEYMDRYGNALIIYEKDDIEVSLNKLLDFLKDYKIIPIEQVKEIFMKNTPEYQANLIKELVLDNRINNNLLK